MLRVDSLSLNDHHTTLIGLHGCERRLWKIRTASISARRSLRDDPPSVALLLAMLCNRPVGRAKNKRHAIGYNRTWVTTIDDEGVG